MDAAPEGFNHPDYSYAFHAPFPNVSKHDMISEDISSRNTSDSGAEESFGNNLEKAIDITVLVICIFGAMGNGIVVWLLGFRIKKNPFIIYILNLGVADFGLLLSIVIHSSWYQFISDSNIILELFLYLFLLMYSASQFLLTAISIDRCVAVYFPVWHRGKRPLRLSTIICALIWVLSILFSAITFTLRFINLKENAIGNYYQFIANATLCVPVMTIATVALFIKVCLKARQHRRERLLTIILITLLCFLLLAFPFNIIFILFVFLKLPFYMPHCAILLACLNSSVNPVIYFLVGRQRKSRCRESVKMILQKVFKEEESCNEETPVETKL